MCVPIDPITTAITTLTAVAGGIVTANQQNRQIKKTNEYRAQIAKNNIQNSVNEARKQQQLGIDKSREEKIEGLKNANRLKAQNAASGFDINSTTNNLNYSDILNTAQANADNIQTRYNENADNYFQRANSYITNYNMNSSINQEKNDLFATALGSVSKVAKNWYSKGGNNGNI